MRRIGKTALAFTWRLTRLFTWFTRQSGAIGVAANRKRIEGEGISIPKRARKIQHRFTRCQIHLYLPFITRMSYRAEYCLLSDTLSQTLIPQGTLRLFRSLLSQSLLYWSSSKQLQLSESSITYQGVKLVSQCCTCCFADCHLQLKRLLGAACFFMRRVSSFTHNSLTAWHISSQPHLAGVYITMSFLCVQCQHLANSCLLRVTELVRPDKFTQVSSHVNSHRIRYIPF